MTRYIKYEKSPGRKRLDGTEAHSDRKETVTTLQVKILASEKAALVDYCTQHNLNMSEVLRDLISNLLKGGDVRQT